ncbi:MAG: ArsR family transcriptional regulator [Anaerolineae bacterium]|nr:MAG: ArsR family transcriptional regulator [Anaerolineae bacterium]
MQKQLIREIHHLHAKICSGLADPNRILILYTLAEGDCNVSHLVETLGIPQPRISRHLKVLRECNLVRSRREGQMVYYTLADRRVIQALDTLRAVMASSLENQVTLAETLTTLD